MADIEEFARQTQEGLKYLLRKRKTKMQEMEEAVEGPIQPPQPVPPPKPENEKELQKRSTGGSPPFTSEEMKRGYRKVG